MILLPPPDPATTAGPRLHLPGAGRTACGCRSRFRGGFRGGFRGNFRGSFRGRGFSLMEVLVATGIFAVGMVAVASIFPVAILLQKRTVNSVNADAFAANAVALVETRGFDERYLENAPGYGSTTGAVPDGVVHPVPEAVRAPQWTLLDRSYGVNEAATDRAVWWVPLFYDANLEPADAVSSNRDWKVYLFVVERDYAATYAKTAPLDWAEYLDPIYVPGVARITANVSGGRFDFTNAIAGDRIVRVGEQVLAANGSVYRVTEADASGIGVEGGVIDSPATTDIWVAHPGTSGQSSFIALVPIDNRSTVKPNNLIR